MRTGLGRTLGSAGLVALAAVIGPAACATGSETLDAAAAAGGGEGGSSAATTASTSASATTGGSGQCVFADDCDHLADECNSGTCINGSCEKTPAAEDAPCSDGLSCTVNDTCKSGQCSGEPKVCHAFTQCMAGYCDPATDACVEVPGNDGAACIDADPCTLDDHCGGGACLPGAAVDCSFLDGVCSQGLCDPALGCVAVPLAEGASCDDSLFCTTGDACTGGVCAGQPKLCVPPGDVCKVGSCNENADSCVIVSGNDGGACDDGNACTTAETCGAGVCGGGVPANAGGPCDDGDACTTVDTCDAAGGCVGGAPIAACIDDDGCCPASCTLADDADCQPACCGGEQNIGQQDFGCIQGAAWIAWEYVPTCGFDLTRLEIRADAGSVALLSDAGGAPGATLFQGPLSAPDADGWIGADVSPAIALASGQKYWIAEAVGQCSISTAGVPYPYYGSFGGLNGPWDGPFTDHPWTSRLIGECR